jgi:ABC-2 type transport system permease protein
MTDLFASELLKLRTIRTTWWVALLALGLVALTVVGQLAGDDIRTENDLRAVVSNSGVAGLLMIVLGVVGSAGEYRHGTITSTFLVIPSRSRVMIVKALAYAAVALLVAIVASALTLAITVPWLSGEGDSLSSFGLGAGEVAGIVVGCSAYAAIAAMLGVGVGALMRSQVAAVVTVLGFLLVLDPVLAALIHGYGRFGLSGLAIALSGGTGKDADYALFSPLLAGLVFLVEAAIVIGVAALLTERRDVS